MKKDIKNLFQITEAAQACGLSRSTLMRMEEKDGELSFAMPDDDEMEKITPFIMELLEHAQGGCTHDCCSCGGCHGHEDEDDCCCDDDCCCQH